MSEFIGARISLISKSDIRYAGILHEINSADSTVSLENVKSFGTEGRKGDPSEEVSPSDQTYEYIVFRGSDVKDLRIEQPGPGGQKENKPPAIPNDPAILGARPHPGRMPVPGGPPGVPGPPGFQNPGMFPPYPPQQGWGRAGLPPGPGGFGMGYPPQGWFPPNQNFPPGAPGPWNNWAYPPGPPGGPPGMPGQANRQGMAGSSSLPSSQPPASDAKPSPIGPEADKQKPMTPVEIPSESRVPNQASFPSAAQNIAPIPPVATKPSTAEVKATAASLETLVPTGPSTQAKPIPTGPKGINRITPVVPLPAALTAKSTQAVASALKQAHDGAHPTAPATSLKDAAEAARAAVAIAMAKLEGGAIQSPSNANGTDNLTKKFNEMRVHAARAGSQNARGRGRGGRPAKIEVPDSDFDFAQSNAKFNKEEVVKEAIAGSPLAETPSDSAKDGQTDHPQAYNKSKSFFDNISSEAKDRLDNHGQKPGGREWRGEEQRRNIETFGQGSVDGGYNRGYRGRGRGSRGSMRGRGRGRGGYRGPRNDAQASTST